MRIHTLHTYIIRVYTYTIYSQNSIKYWFSYFVFFLFFYFIYNGITLSFNLQIFMQDSHILIVSAAQFCFASFILYLFLFFFFWWVGHILICLFPHLLLELDLKNCCALVVNVYIKRNTYNKLKILCINTILLMCVVCMCICCLFVCCCSCCLQSQKLPANFHSFLAASFITIIIIWYNVWDLFLVLLRL